MGTTTHKCIILHKFNTNNINIDVSVWMLLNIKFERVIDW